MHVDERVNSSICNNYKIKKQVTQRTEKRNREFHNGHFKISLSIKERISD